MRTLLRSGPWSAVLSPTGELGPIRWGGVEVVRRVAVAVRDADWGTVAPVVERVDVEVDSDCARLRVRHREGEIDFTWDATIRLCHDGVDFAFDGTAGRSFERNRIGLIVLHPLATCVGASADIEHVDGSTESSVFPTEVAPDQPFRDMKSLEHELALHPGSRVRFTWTGETFETEDQRNWSDASFKTYGTPLGLPFPVAINAGDRVRQSVTVVGLGSVPEARGSTSTVRLVVDPDAPGMRVGVAAGPELQSLPPGDPLVDHLLLPVDADDPEVRVRIADGVRAAAKSARSLHIALRVPTNLSSGRLEDVAAAVAAETPSRVTWTVLPRQPAAVAKDGEFGRVRDAILALRPGDDVGAGTDAYLAELNRNPMAHLRASFASFSLTPQVHDDGDEAVLQSVEAMPAMIRRAQTVGAAAVHVAPVTLRPRFNPNATRATRHLRRSADPRLATRWAAAWAVGVIAGAAAAGAHSVTMQATDGVDGVVDGDVGFPIWEVISRAQPEALPVASDHPDVVAFVSRPSADRFRLVVANIGADVRDVSVGGMPAVAAPGLAPGDFASLEW